MEEDDEYEQPVERISTEIDVKIEGENKQGDSFFSMITKGQMQGALTVLRRDVTEFGHNVNTTFSKIGQKTEQFGRTLINPITFLWNKRERTKDIVDLAESDRDGGEKGCGRRVMDWMVKRIDYFRANIIYFAFMVLVGGITIYIAERKNEQMIVSFEDAVFTSASALCVTGLSVVDASKFSLTSQITLICLFQLGGTVLMTIPPLVVRRYYLRKAAIKAQRLQDMEEMKRKQLELESKKAAVQTENEVNSNNSQDIQKRGSAVMDVVAEMPTNIEEIDKMTDEELLDLWSYQFEYNLLGHLSQAVFFYLFFTYLFFFALLTFWTSYYPPTYDLLEDKRIKPAWFSVFHIVSAFNNAGFSLFSENLVPFNRDPVIMLSISFLTCMGNTFFPVFLRLVIYIFRKLSRDPVYYKYMLVHPTETFTHLFPPLQTRTLFFALSFMLFFQTIYMLVFDWNNPTFNEFSWRLRLIIAFTQSACSRTSGFNVFDLSTLQQGVQFLTALMMYIASYPFVITSEAATNYNQIYSYDMEAEKALRNAEGKRIDSSTKGSPFLETMKAVWSYGKVLFLQDSTWLILALLIITTIESDKIATDMNFSIFRIIFEMASAYGTVGLTLGYPGIATSFSTVLSPVSKAMMILAMVIGRCRGYLMWLTIHPHGRNPDEKPANSPNDEKEKEKEKENSPNQPPQEKKRNY